MTAELKVKELHRRSLVKSLLWRVIGVVWTWIGAYIIMRFIPPSRQTAAYIATLIVVYHHSTRMIMYYIYERVWASVKWGRFESPEKMSLKQKMAWTLGTVTAIAAIFFLLLEVHPRIKERRNHLKKEVHSLSSRKEQPFYLTWTSQNQKEF